MSFNLFNVFNFSDICLQCFVAKGSLKTHSQIHSNVKPFKCTECQFAFSTRGKNSVLQNRHKTKRLFAGSLTRHMTRHSSERPYMCPYCTKTFKSSLNCKKHIKLHRTEFALQLMNEQQNRINVENSGQPMVQPSATKTPVEGVSLIDKNISQMTSNEQLIDANSLNVEYVVPTVVSQQTFTTDPLHSNVVIGTDEVRPHQCQVCGAAFKKSSHLKQVLICNELNVI